MANEKSPEPLWGAPPEEVPLSKAPLIRVLAQVMFPDQVQIRTNEGVAAFQKEVKSHYPLFDEEIEQMVNVDIATGTQNITTRPLRRFHDVKRKWRLTLALNAITLDTTAYTSRADFLARLSFVLRAVNKCFDPRVALRIGMRYVDRVSGEDAISQLGEYVNPSMLGIASTNLQNYVQHALTEAVLRVEEGNMMLRWGLLPPNGTVDPGAIEPINERSWILDIDVWSIEQREFDLSGLDNDFENLAKRAYSAFRFMTTESFLRNYGG